MGWRWYSCYIQVLLHLKNPRVNVLMLAPFKIVWAFHFDSKRLTALPSRTPRGNQFRSQVSAVLHLRASASVGSELCSFRDLPLLGDSLRQFGVRLSCRL